MQSTIFIVHQQARELSTLICSAFYAPTLTQTNNPFLNIPSYYSDQIRIFVLGAIRSGSWFTLTLSSFSLAYVHTFNSHKNLLLLMRLCVAKSVLLLSLIDNNRHSPISVLSLDHGFYFRSSAQVRFGGQPAPNL